MENFLQERKDYLLLISDTINNIEHLTNLEIRINKIKNYIFSEISKGNLLEKEFLYLGLLIKRQKVDISCQPQIPELKNNLSTLLNKFPDNSKEIFAINDNIFLLSILCGNLENGLKNYIKNIFILDFHAGINFGYRDFLPQAITLLNPGSDVLFDVIKELFQNYLSFKKKQRRSMLNWIWQCLWPSQIILQIRKEVFELYPILKVALYKLIEKEKIDEVMIFSMFIFNIMINVIDEPKNLYPKIQKEITEPCCNLYNMWIKKHKDLLRVNEFEKSNKRKVKIALVRPHIGYWSPFKIEYSLLKALKINEEFNKKYEIAVYSFDSLDLWAGRGDDPKCIKMLKEAGIKYFSPVNCYNEKYGYYTNYHKKILDFRKKIIEDEIDILIYSDHLYSVGEFLFLSRTAPMQIYWSQGNDFYNVDNIDKRICISKPACKKFKWNLFKIDSTNELLLGTEEDKNKGYEIKQKFIKKYGENTVILGYIGRLTKIDNLKYLDTISKILNTNKNSIYLACGAGNEESIKEKIKRCGIPRDRFIFTGFVNPHVYGWVIDIFLASFPMGSGQALDEYRRKGKAYVTMCDKEYLGNLKRDFKVVPERLSFIQLYSGEQKIKLFNMEPIIDENRYSFTYQTISHVFNCEDYVKVANRLINDEELKEKIIEEHKYIFEQNKVSIIDEFLRIIDD